MRWEKGLGFSVAVKALNPNIDYKIRNINIFFVYLNNNFKIKICITDFILQIYTTVLITTLLISKL